MMNDDTPNQGDDRTDDRTATTTTDRHAERLVYSGFVQAICWGIRDDMLTINEPDEIWVDSDYLTFDHDFFISQFADFDSESPVILMHYNDDATTWNFYCTETDNFSKLTDDDLAGFHYAVELNARLTRG